MPRVFGTNGDDLLNGSAGDDEIHGLYGNDEIVSGDGNDRIIEVAGSNIIRSGSGNDWITLHAYPTLYDEQTTNLVEAGDGDDLLQIDARANAIITADMGAGNDRVELAVDFGLIAEKVTLTLGAGSDRVNLGFYIGDRTRASSGMIVITDFQSGVGGDVLALGDFLNGLFHGLGLGQPTANPFDTQHFFLVQDGADVVLWMDVDGSGPGHSNRYRQEIVRLQNVNAAELTAWNFGGYDPAGGGSTKPDVRTGTSQADTITAGNWGSRIDGLDGDDQLLGGSGPDRIDGGIGNDRLDGGRGDDTLIGGDSNDVITDRIGNDTIDGGRGDDIIDLDRTASLPIHETLTIIGGDGNDRVRYVLSDNTFLSRSAALTIDLGAGNDHLYLSRSKAAATVTLGAGQDRVEVGEQFLNNFAGGFVINDFQAGNGGDILELGNFVYLTSWDRKANPFTSGHIQLVQDGADTLVQVDYHGDDTAIFTVVRLKGVTATSLTAHNFEGYAPTGAIVAASLTGTANADELIGTVGNDQLRGMGGDDILVGSWGNDLIEGGDGNDVLSGGHGTDQLMGGIGHDLIEDLDGGDDILDGGDGDDRINIARRSVPGPEHITIRGGRGNDHVDVYTYGYGSVTVDLGEGDDRFDIRGLPDGGVTITTGAGRDLISLHNDLLRAPDAPIIVTDFQTGDLGDRLDWAHFAMWEAVPFNFKAGYNPFAEGQASLVQVGANVELRLAPYDRVLIVFRNTRVENFTDFNLGVDIHARPPVPDADTKTGTWLDETLDGTNVRDVISGLGGADRINGFDGNDWLKGGDGPDEIYGGAGDDVIEGGPELQSDMDNRTDILDGGIGNDIITARSAALIRGGDGNDVIDAVINHDPDTPVASLDAGAGNDRVKLEFNGASDYTVSLGSGDDLLDLNGIGASFRLNLGEGRDSIVLGSIYFSNGSQLIVTDFAGGANGDRIDIDAWLAAVLAFWLPTPDYWVPGKNPFALGYVELRQKGTSVELILWADAQARDFSWGSIIFENTRLEDLTAENFGGYDPHVPANRAIIVDQEDWTNPAGNVITQLNTTPVYTERPAISFFGNGRAVNEGTIIARETDPATWLMGFAVAYGNGTGPDALFHNRATGRFIVRSEWLDESLNASYGRTFGYYAGQMGTHFLNEGYFEVTARSGTAYGIRAGYDPTVRQFVNRGEMYVYSRYDARGVELAGSGAFENHGMLTVIAGEIAIGVYFSGFRNNSFANHGTIEVIPDPQSPYLSIGIYISHAHAGGSATHLNTGTITADLAFWVEEVNRTSDGSGVNDVLTNSGTINGDIALGLGDDVLSNSGTLRGTIDLGGGNDQYQGAPGLLIGEVHGGAGNDTLTGGASVDWLSGGDGDDVITGGAGIDRLAGGLGSDRFVYGALSDSSSYLLRPEGGKDMPDLIRDFQSGQDKIDLSAIDAVAGTAANDAFLFIGAAAFSKRAGELRVVAEHGAVNIYVDVDGNGVADMQITVQGDVPLVSDFIL